MFASAPSFNVPAPARIVAVLLALSATGISAALSIVSASERGGWAVERAIWIGVSLVLLTGAHCLPALSRYLPRVARVPAAALWIVAMAAKSYGHITFFLMAQQHAGMARAGAIAAPTVTSAPVASISLTTLASQRASAQEELVRLAAVPCTTKCAMRDARRGVLLARLDALSVELDEAKRAERRQERALNDLDLFRARQDAALADPVATALAHISGISASGIDLLIGVAFGVALEVVACFAWFLALPAARSGLVRESHAVVTQSNEPVPVFVAQTSSSHAVNSQVMDTSPDWSVIDDNAGTVRLLVETDVSKQLAEVMAAVKAGTCRATVAGIRVFLKCSQDRARDIRRELGELMPEQVGRSRAT